jgi:ethanolamine utilization protein EutN
MILGRVTGEVVATIQHAAYGRRRVLMVDRITPHGREVGTYLVALDTVGAGVGQTVLIVDEGNSARQVLGDALAPVRSVIVGIVDTIQTAG